MHISRFKPKDRRLKPPPAYLVPISLILAEGKNPKWNQTFQLEVKDSSDDKVKVSLCEKDDKGV